MEQREAPTGQRVASTRGGHVSELRQCLDDGAFRQRLTQLPDHVLRNGRSPQDEKSKRRDSGQRPQVRNRRAGQVEQLESGQIDQGTQTRDARMVHEELREGRGAAERLQVRNLRSAQEQRVEPGEAGQWTKIGDRRPSQSRDTSEPCKQRATPHPVPASGPVRADRAPRYPRADPDPAPACDRDRGSREPGGWPTSRDPKLPSNAGRATEAP